MDSLRSASRTILTRAKLLRTALTRTVSSSDPKQASSKPPKRTKEFTPMERNAYSWSRFNRYGLYHNDCLDETPDVKEAIRRLPQKLVDERNFRILRAMQYSMMKVYLPTEEWIKIDEDYRYLQPYLDEVVREREEREEWNRNN